ncbi:MAG: hypothetical protein PF551_07695 [Candidatus Marinimicrobia bacterium]|jgi:hypothetical protein|nr:hypothetical protein [Candidatus Neomarinimicrobiota bacterium]
MKRKKIIFITIIFFLISIINLNAEEDEPQSSFEQLLQEITSEENDTLLKTEKELAKNDRESNRFMLTISSGYLIPYGGNIDDAYYDGYGGSIQLKISNVYNFLGFKHHLGIEGGYYFNNGNSRSDLTTCMANFIISTDIKKKTKAIFGYEIGGGYYLQDLEQPYNSTTTATDLGMKGGIKLGYKMTDNFYFTVKGGGIYIIDDFETGNTQEYLIGNLDISYIF